MDQMAALSMVFTFIMAALIGGFILMYPITKRLGAYLERRVEEGGGNKVGPDSLEAVHRALAEVRDQLEDLRERQDFVEKLVEGRRERRVLPDPRAGE